MTPATLDSDVDAGQAVYTRPTLAVYDHVALGFLCRFIWKCPVEQIIEAYDQHVSNNHLEVGVGTGFVLDHCRFPTSRPRLTLLDLNPNSLLVAGRRLARYHPETCQANVLEPLPIDEPQFDSIGVGALLHCLPGPMSRKGVAFDHLKAVLKPGGILFGGTLLSGGVPRTAAARLVMKLLNRAKIFSNADDDLDGLVCELEKRFSKVVVRVVGCAAMFSARLPAF